MKLIWAILGLLSVGVQQANGYYFNLGGFLEPILNPKHDVFGHAEYHQKHLGLESLAKFDERQIFRFNHQNQHQNQHQNLRREGDKVATDIYKAIGIPQDIIYNKVLPVHMSARRDLNRYFYKHSISARGLYESLLDLKELMEWITKTYLQNVDNLVIGDNNNVEGHNIFVSGQNQKIEGQSILVFNPRFKDIPIKGNNIVRIGRFDVDLDKIEEVKRDPYKAVDLLQIEEAQLY